MLGILRVVLTGWDCFAFAGMARVMAMLAGGGELDGVRVLSEAGRDSAIANPIRCEISRISRISRVASLISRSLSNT